MHGAGDMAAAWIWQRTESSVVDQLLGAHIDPPYIASSIIKSVQLRCLGATPAHSCQCSLQETEASLLPWALYHDRGSSAVAMQYKDMHDSHTLWCYVGQALYPRGRNASMHRHLAYCRPACACRRICSDALSHCWQPIESNAACVWYKCAKLYQLTGLMMADGSRKSGTARRLSPRW
jgi:hypothetical protein